MHIVVSGIAAAEELEDVVKRVNPDVVLTGIDAEALKPPYRSFLFTSRSVPIIAIRERDDTFEIFSRRAVRKGNDKDLLKTIRDLVQQSVHDSRKRQS